MEGDAMLAPGTDELFMMLFGMAIALVPVVVVVVVVVALFRRLNRIVAATEATAEAVRRLESAGRPNI